MPKRLTQEKFIQRAREIHGDKYDYSKVKYVNSKTKVCIICPIHGEFWIRPNDLLNGHSCPKCYEGRRGSTLKNNTKEFIKKAREIHGDKYDYSKVDYVNNHTKVCIICPIHGEFWQVPNSHLQGKGCPHCNSSKLEDEIELLLNPNIEFERQKRFKWLGIQSLDFYIPKYNIGIECQGIQHFKPRKHFGGEDGFKKTLERDERKRKLCEEHGIRLLYYSNLRIDYPYKVFEDKEELLKEIKKEGGN